MLLCWWSEKRSWNFKRMSPVTLAALFLFFISATLFSLLWFFNDGNWRLAALLSEGLIFLSKLAYLAIHILDSILSFFHLLSQLFITFKQLSDHVDAFDQSL